MNITGNLTNLKIDAEGQIENVEGQISEVTLQNGDKITILGEIKRIMRESRTSTASAFKVEIPGKPAEFISSDTSPKLFNDDGSPRELPQGAVVKQEFQAKAGSEEENLQEEAQEASAETGEAESSQEASVETESSVEASAEAKAEEA